MANILITGATGQLGTIVVEHLLKTVPAQNITVLVRDEQKASKFSSKGIKVKQGDYTNTASLNDAMLGIDKVLLISSNDFNDRIGQHKNVIDAAKNNGVKHILYTSVAINDIEKSPLKPLLGDHFETEAYIKASGLTYTLLQNSLYHEVIALFAGEKALETGIFFAAGEGKVAFASRFDLGEAAANILATSGHENKTYYLAASTAYSFQDIAKELSALSGKEVNYTSPSTEEFEVFLKQIGLPEGLILMSSLFAAGIKNNDFDKTDTTLLNLLNRPETALKTYLKETFKI